MLDASSTLYGEIRGHLAAFSLLACDNAPEISYRFEFTRLEKVQTAKGTLEQHFQQSTNAISLLPLPAWRGTFQKELRHWIFDHVPLPAWRDTRWRFQQAKNICDQIEQLVLPSAVWHVQFQPNGFYRVRWENFALENATALYLLHLSQVD